jgi:DhnA family fructose-bisphosphate aldolase class Ia
VALPHGVDVARQVRAVRGGGFEWLAVALDHGLSGPREGLECPSRTLRQILAQKPDAVLASLGMARAHREEIAAVGAQVVISLDAPLRRRGEVVGHARVAWPEQLARMGASHAKVMLLWEGDHEQLVREVELVTTAVRECMAVGIQVMVEPIPLRRASAHPTVPADEDFALSVLESSRIASELGASALKVPFVSSQHLKAIVQASFCPVVVLGGPRTSDDRFISDMRAAMSAGATGLAVGRNIWQRNDAATILDRLRQLATVTQPLSRAET